MSRLPPHKRDLLTLYWSHFWAYESYLRMGPVTEEETRKHLTYLDHLWGKMSLGAKKMVDPLWESGPVQEGKWIELRSLMCPHCGWIHHVTPASSGPPRCNACMLDMGVSTKPEEIKQRLHDLQVEREKVLDEVFRTRNSAVANATLEQINLERDKLLALQAQLKGVGAE